MKYCSQYIWESGCEEKDNSVSLVLQQVKLGGEACLLACVCEMPGDAGGCFTEQLVEWFHRRCLPLLQTKCSVEDVTRGLRRELMRIEKEIGENGAAEKESGTADAVIGILLYDNQFWLFWKGECRGYLFNRRFQRRQRKDLIPSFGEKAGQLQILQGSVQKNIGLLFCNSGFGDKVEAEEMIQVLAAEDLKEEDLRKRLRELWKEALHRELTAPVGAIYIRTE